MNSNLGCVLALRDRPPEYLERTLQTFAYQSLQPLDKILVDSGSSPDLSAAYQQLCDQYGWRFLRQEPTTTHWRPAVAYNTAVNGLDDGVAVVFKSDIDVLLGRDVLSAAIASGRESLCTFACLTTAAGTNYPKRLESHDDVVRLLSAPHPLLPMPFQAVHAYPRRWFTAIGGYDLEFAGRGDEDADLCQRARQSIGVVENTTALLIHQWHPLPERLHDTAFDRNYHQRIANRHNLVRNGGVLLQPNPPVLETAPPPEAPQAEPKPKPAEPSSPASSPNGELLQPESSIFASMPCSPNQVRSTAQTNIRLSLCMIVRDNASILPTCLESIRPWVDEMIVVDTGSRDETPRLAQRLGARVFSFPWCDDFAKARNESLRHARGHWLLWMDSDDVIDAANGRKLRALAREESDPAILGYIMQVHCPGPGDDGALHTTVVDHVKLLRNRPDVAFEGRIHEQVLSSIRRLKGEVAWTDIFVVHAGYDHSPEARARKRERDLRLLHLEHQERGDHPFTLFNLGMTYTDLGRYPEAMAYLRRSITCATPGESHLRKAYALLVLCHQQQGNPEAAWAACQEGLRRTPGDQELCFRAGLLLHESGRLEEAARTYEELLAAAPERHFSSIDQGITGYKARQNLAIVYQELGQWREATDQWRQVVSERPGYRIGWRGLVESLLRQGQRREAEVLLEQLGDEGALGCEKSLLRGQVALASGDASAARQAITQAVASHAEDEAAWQALCRFLFDHGSPDETEQALKELLRRQPSDAAVFHNLGTVYLRLGRAHAAVEAYRQSLQLRPRAPATAQLLELALRQTTSRKMSSPN